MKPALRDTQIAFHNHLLDQPSAIAEEIVDGGKVGIDLRLHIYHNAYRVRLQECLQDTFEKTWAYLGDNAFEAAALAYIEMNPSTSRSLRDFGEMFPAMLADRFPADGDIAELAEIDWHLRRAFDGPNADPIDSDTLATLAAEDWETVGFLFAPTVQLLPVRYNSAGIWHALDETQVPPTAEALPGPAWLLIWRKGWQPHFRTIGEAEHKALASLIQGNSFADVCAAMAEQFSDEDATLLAGERLGAWLQDELIVALTGT
jgi:hypothetical protein